MKKEKVSDKASKEDTSKESDESKEYELDKSDKRSQKEKVGETGRKVTEKREEGKDEMKGKK